MRKNIRPRNLRRKRTKFCLDEKNALQYAFFNVEVSRPVRRGGSGGSVEPPFSLANEMQAVESEHTMLRKQQRAFAWRRTRAACGFLSSRYSSSQAFLCTSSGPGYTGPLTSDFHAESRRLTCICSSWRLAEHIDEPPLSKSCVRAW